ncbi:uncharacterized protein LOC116428803 [Nomia melanderi]|uniref:uncharacterized protein LOC116428803 n=1 Tax=Nomia melanderi TaxID=2448451 RepID=UPI001304237D|nr:uncharacterized protein LOC116428803 [Nomia melanderi]
MSSSSDNQFYRQRKLYRRKKSKLHHSTPVETAAGPSSTSISTIEKYSASSTDNKRIPQLSNVPKIKRKRKTKRIPKKLETEENSDSDWVTIQDTSLNEKENVQPDTKTSPRLFSDYDSPEHVREAQHFYDFSFDPSVRRSLRWDTDNRSPEKIKDHVEPLATVDLPRFRTPIVAISEDEEENRTFRKENAVKKYVNRNERRKPKPIIMTDRPKQLLDDVTFPTTTLADILWDDLVAKNPKEMRQWVNPSSTKKPTKQKDTDSEDEDDEDWKTKPLWPEYKVPEGMSVTRGHFDRAQKKWIRKYDPHKFPESEDKDFKRDKVTGARKMTLNQYLQKCRLQKQNEEKINKKREEKGKKRKHNVWSITRRINSSGDELQRTQIQHKVDQDSDQDSDQESIFKMKRILRKREYELNRSPEIQHAKRKKTVEENKPKIRSVETLIDSRYKIKRIDTAK